MLPLNTLQAMVPIVDAKTGRPTPQFAQLVQAIVEHIKDIEARLTTAGIP
jgi:NifB/MoaA-like Fe-S oxidoreductase